MAKRKKATPEKAEAKEDKTVVRYKYIGPKVDRLNFPALRFSFRPALLTDNQVQAILKQYPDMIRYFIDSAAAEQE